MLLYSHLFKSSPDSQQQGTSDKMSKYAFVFSDDEEEDDYNDDDYQPSTSKGKVKKSTVVVKQTKKNVKSSTNASKIIPKKAIKPKNATRKKILSKIVESSSSSSSSDYEKKEEKEEDLTYWKTLDNEKSNLIDTQKAAIEKLMEENAALQRRLIQEKEEEANNSSSSSSSSSSNSSIQQENNGVMTPEVVSENDGVMTPEVISEYEEEEEKEEPMQSNEEEGGGEEEKKIVNVNENRYDWLDVITDNTRCRELYHISSFQLTELDKFISPHFESSRNPISKSIVYSKQLLMLLDYILNGAPINEIARRARLLPSFVTTLLHIFINHFTTIIQKETILVLNQNLTEVNFNRNYYFIIDPKNGKIIKHKYFGSLVKFRIKWYSHKRVHVSSAHGRYGTELLYRMADLCRIMSHFDSITNRNIMPLIYAIWNRLGYS